MGLPDHDLRNAQQIPAALPAPRRRDFQFSRLPSSQPFHGPGLPSCNHPKHGDPGSLDKACHLSNSSMYPTETKLNETKFSATG